MASADRILLVVDTSDRGSAIADIDELWPELHRELGQSIPVTIVHNKCDVTGESPGVDTSGDPAVITLSAKTGEGLELLRSHLKAAMGYESDAAHGFIARRRHILALERAREALKAGVAQLDSLAAGELLAEDLRRCHACLGEITGAMSADELLGEIFGSFCIGK